MAFRCEGGYIMSNLDLDIGENFLLLESKFLTSQNHPQAERHSRIKGALSRRSLCQDKIQTRQFAYPKLAQAGPC